MKNNNKKKTSASRKLIPAVAMLTTSAVMLSTATYAWFTLNKEVEVTGIQMSATAGDSLEVSLGAIGTSTKSPSADAPAMDDLSWKRSINISEYYDSVGSLKPASSASALTLYHTVDKSGANTIDDVGIYAGGHEIEDGTTVDVASKAATLALGTVYQNDTFANAGTSDAEGYYVDIPVYLRCSRNVATDIDCAVTITDPDETNGSELIKAVRVAVVPTASSAQSEATAPTITNGAITGSSASIFALDKATYHNAVIASAGTYPAVRTGNPTINDAVAARLTTDGLEHDNTVDDAAKTPHTTVFQMPAADKDMYSVESFVVRVWIEGESKSCEDATANQDWNIDLLFKIKEAAAPSPDVTP